MWDDYESGDAPKRLSVKELERLAAERLAELQAEGRELQPLKNSTRKLAVNFWGSAWMKHLANCEEGGLCLAPGRSLLRHGCVLDLRIAPGMVRALVSSDELYEVELCLAPLDDERVEQLRELCSGHIDSLMSLLEGKVDTALLARLCDPENGLLPEPHEWRMRCSCPDWTSPCPHAAAAIYGAGVLMDADPSLLFELRGITPAQLLAAPVAAAADFDTAALSATFGIDLDLN